MTLSSLVEACLSFLLTVASHKAAAKALVMNNIDHTLCLSLGNVLALREQGPHADSPMEMNGGSYGNWRRVWLKSLGLVTVLLTSLGHTYSSGAVDFVGVYQQQLIRVSHHSLGGAGRGVVCLLPLLFNQALDISMATTTGIDAEEVLCAVSLVSHLMQFRERWRFLQPQVFMAIMVRAVGWGKGWVD